MYLLDISLQSRVIIGISAMVFLFCSFLVSFISNQRKKLKYQKNLQLIQQQQQQALMEQNMLLEERVRERTVELSEQKDSLQTALSELKASQLQLVQKEKMASLGEIASGIAHEIQNPLNFVNNFAEINAELLLELKDLLELENTTLTRRGEMNMLMADVINNLQKIHQHGKRADAIVKSMLQHTRTSNAQLEETDINELASEYLKLAYHGQKVKEGSFNVNLVTDFSEDLKKLKVIPHDIGRVLLNLYNNAFYAIKEKKKVSGESYEPIIIVATRKTDHSIEVRVKDNGSGIPEAIKGKIFQPFFTTKPTGEGTGLGLSLSYEVIKAHGGELKMASEEGVFTEFTIVIPV
jgi:two-component system, NtrC family, sensor kinase